MKSENFVEGFAAGQVGRIAAELVEQGADTDDATNVLLQVAIECLKRTNQIREKEKQRGEGR